MTTGASSITAFGVFEVDRQSGELRKQGVRVRLPAQPFQVLTVLLDRAGEVVGRDELQRHVWPADTFVDFDRGLNKAVNRLREVLGDTADSPRFIETIPKRGYRFIAPVRHGTAEAPPHLAVPRTDRVDAPARAPGNRPTSTDTPLAAAQSPTTRWHPSGLARVLGAAALTVALAGAGSWMLGTQPASEPVRVVLAGVANRTSDPVFDHTVTQALAVQLQQSPIVQVVSEHEVRRTLALMRRAVDGALAPQLAGEVCRRANGHAVLGGTLSLVGSEYVLGLEGFDCHTGTSLIRRQLRASRKEDVLRAVDAAAPDVRRRLGESLGSVRRFDSRLHSLLTTRSLDAFEAYTAGERNVLQQGGWSAVPFFRRAVEIDPEFAYAHAALGLVLGTFGEAAESIRHTQRAYQLRDRVSEWERLFITAQYHDRVTGHLDAVLTTCEVWAQTYPHDRTARNRLAAAHNQLGRPAEALAQLDRARSLGRDHPLDVDAWAATALRLNRVDEALGLVDPLVARTPDRVPLRRTAYRLHFAAGRRAEMDAALQWAERTPRAEALFAEQAATDAYAGGLRRSREWTQRAVDAAVRNEFRGNAALWTAVHGIREALLGNESEARARANAALALEENWETRALAAVSLARVGAAAEAGALASRLEAERPTGTLARHYWLPVVRALQRLHSGDATAAIDALRAAEPYELADTRVPLLPVFVRGEAHLRARDGRGAAAQFRKVLEHRGAVGSSVLAPLSRLGLARALAMTGDTAGASSSYAAFVDAWRDADPDVPVLQQARAERHALAVK